MACKGYLCLKNGVVMAKLIDAGWYQPEAREPTCVGSFTHHPYRLSSNHSQPVQQPISKAELTDIITRSIKKISA